MMDVVEQQEEFEAAANFLPTLASNLGQDDLLYFYARFKQAKEGPCHREKPGFFDFQGKQKWSAWKELGDMSKEEAMQQYVDKLTALDPQWSYKEVSEQDHSWVSVSSMANNEVALADKDKTVFDWVKEGNLERVAVCLREDPAAANRLDGESMGLIHWAADRGSGDMVRLLLKHGAQVNLQDADMQTALHYACSVGHVDVVKALLEASIDTSIKDNDGCTALETTGEGCIRKLFE